MRSLFFYAPDRISHRLRAEDHSRSPSKGAIIDPPIFMEGEIADIGVRNFDDSLFSCPFQHTHIEGSFKIGGKEGKDMNFHFALALRFTLFFSVFTTFFK